MRYRCPNCLGRSFMPPRASDAFPDRCDMCRGRGSLSRYAIAKRCRVHHSVITEIERSPNGAGFVGAARAFDVLAGLAALEQVRESARSAI